MKAFVFVAIVALAGCGDSGPTVTAQPMKGAQRPPYASLLEAHQDGDQQALRVRVDTARNRLWVLGLDDVFVYDIATKHLIRRIALPEWYVAVADLICNPDMALDRSGAAFISDNLQPTLLEIDPESFQLKRHAIRLVNREHWDTGFGGLAFAPDGTLFGLTATSGSLWRIDTRNAAAHQVVPETLMPDACALTAGDLVSPP